MVLAPLPNDLKQTVLDAFNKIDVGFCWEEKAIKLAETVLALKPKKAVEIGVWGGKSFIPICVAMEYLNNLENTYNQSYGIDVWDAVEASKHYEYPHKEYWGRQDVHNFAYERCMYFVSLLKTANVKIIKDTSENACYLFDNGSVDLCHIDGNHSAEEFTRDILNWWPKLSIGGVLVLDDIGWIPTDMVTMVEEKCKEVWSYNHKNTNGGDWGSVLFLQKIKE